MCSAAGHHYRECVPHPVNTPLEVPVSTDAKGASRTSTTVLAMVAAGVGFIEAATIIALAVANRSVNHGLASIDSEDIIVPITFGIVGALVASRQPRNVTGWLFLFTGIVSGIQGVTDQYARFAYLNHPGAPGGIWALWLDSWVITLVFPVGALALLLLHFPNGRLPSRRWRPVRAASVFLSLLIAIPGGALAPGPLGTETKFATPQNPVGIGNHGVVGTALGVIAFLWLASLVILVVAAAAPLVRMRRSQADERQQLKWMAYAVIVSATVVVALTLAGTLIPHFASGVSDLAIALGFGVAVPGAAAIAIFKYRLYDIDIIISRTLVYGALAVFITAVYVGIAVGVGALLGGGGKPNLPLSIVATAIVAIGFQPVRESVQRFANRLVYGRRATPYEVLSQFSGRVAESYATEDVMPRMARVLAEGTGAQRAHVWLCTGEVWREAAVWPGDLPRAETVVAGDDNVPPIDGASRVVEVRHQGDLLGALAVTKRSGESLTPVEENLLTHLAGQAGLVLRNVGLTTDLQTRLEELRASRQRLVTAQDEERRRLERNLHDGAQQYLVAIKVKLGLAEMLVGRDPAKAQQTVAQLKVDADQALETLRDLARGIYPPLLADRGLQVALESQARKSTIPVIVEAAGLGRYPQDIEAAVYFCVLEALQNIQKYANASRAVVRIRAENGGIRFDVEDDGEGFDPLTAHRGAGLSNMEDRLDALGGGLSIRSSRGSGTTITGTVETVPGLVAV